MTPDQLRAQQKPLKDRYAENPDAAKWTLSVEGDVDAANLICSVDMGFGTAQAGLHPAVGGDGSAACSGDMLLQALVACAGVPLSAVATSMGIAIRSARIRADGDLDFRGTLGNRGVPVGFSAIRLHFDVDAPEDKDLAKLLELTERYCVVFQTLAASPTVSASIARAKA